VQSATWPLFKRLLQRSSAPIILGPWKGEVGFEALYWIPFLRKLGLPKERLIALTRGGAHLWYPADRHLDLYSLREPKDLRIDTMLTHAKTGMMKQQAWTKFERQVVKDAAKQLGLTRYHVLHPHWMFRTLWPFWTTTRGLTWLLQHLDIQSLPAVSIDGATLPPSYVAVRFYARPTFPMHDATMTVATEAVKQLAKQHTVILLNSGIHADDHVDFTIPAMPNVLKMTDLFATTAENNLSLQSAILSHAQAFVGTYGGLAQLAMLYRKPTVSFYQDWHGTCLAHKHLMDAVGIQMGVPTQVLKLHEIPLLHAAVPRITVNVQRASSAAVPA
jgi:hypothetical protein